MLGRRLVSLIAMLAVALVLSGSALAASSDTTAVSGPAATAARASSLELAIVRELNRVRAQNGLRPVKLSRALTTAALGHSAGMLESGVFDHTSADGTTFDKRLVRSYPMRGFATWTVGENLLYDSGDVDAAGAVEAWMNSPAHRENMLNGQFREVGVGALHADVAPGDFGGGPALVITLDFGARSAAHR